MTNAKADPGFHDNDPEYCKRVLLALNTRDPEVLALVIGDLKPSLVASGDFDMSHVLKSTASHVVLKHKAGYEHLCERSGTVHVKELEISDIASAGREPWPEIMLPRAFHFLPALFPKLRYLLDDFDAAA